MKKDNLLKQLESTDYWDTYIKEIIYSKDNELKFYYYHPDAYDTEDKDFAPHYEVILKGCRDMRCYIWNVFERHQYSRNRELGETDNLNYGFCCNIDFYSQENTAAYLDIFFRAGELICLCEDIEINVITTPRWRHQLQIEN